MIHIFNLETRISKFKMESVDSKSKGKKKHPIFNNEYEILSSLGDGNTSKVYMCRSLEDPTKKVALKLLRDEFLNRSKDSIKSVEREI